MAGCVAQVFNLDDLALLNGYRRFTPHFSGGILYCSNNIVVSCTATKITLQCLPYLLLAGVRVSSEKVFRRHHHPWCTKATLQAMLLLEPFLDGVHAFFTSQALNGEYAATVYLDGSGGARLYGESVHFNYTGTTATGIATNVRAREAAFLS